MFWSKQRRLERARDRFAKDDPLHYLHVLRADRLDHDEPQLDDSGVGVDLSWYLENPGEVAQVEDE